VLTGDGISLSNASQIISNTVSGASTGIMAGAFPTLTLIAGNRLLGNDVGVVAHGAIVQRNLFSHNGNGISISSPTVAVLSNTVLYQTHWGLEVHLPPTAFHGNNLIGSAEYEVKNATSLDVTAGGNWWGTTDTNAIDEAIFDDADGDGLGHVDYGGFLTGPSQDAPAYVTNVTVAPDSVLGIQTGTFDVSFSRPMLESHEPIVNFNSVWRERWQDYALPAPMVFDVVIDADNSIWLASAAGAGHFDGQTFQLYTTSNSGLPANQVVAVAVDSEGVKWFAGGGYLSRFDGSSWSVIDLGPLGLSNVASLGAGPDGSVWVGTNGDGVGRLKDGAWTMLSPIPGATYSQIVVESNGTAWFVTDNNGVARLQGSTTTLYNPSTSPLTNQGTHVMAIDAQGVKWFAHENNLLRFDNTTWVTYPVESGQLPGFPVDSIAFDDAGGLWLAFQHCTATEYGLTSCIAHQVGTDWDDYGRSCPMLRVDGARRVWCASGGGSVSVLGNDRVYDLSGAGQWLDDHTWRASHDFTALVPRDTYSLTIAGAAGLDGLLIAPDAHFTFTVDYAGTITDQSAPAAPSVFATGDDGDPSAARASWTSHDSESAITGYRYAIGASEGAADIVNWTPTAATTAARAGLGLLPGQTYWVSVQAQNTGGLWSPVAGDAFIAGETKTVSIYVPLVTR
jgi:hypothetical protein